MKSITFPTLWDSRAPYLVVPILHEYRHMVFLFYTTNTHQVAITSWYMFFKSGQISNVMFDGEQKIIAVKLNNHMVFVTNKQHQES
jgi:hypothetical protein